MMCLRPRLWFRPMISRTPSHSFLRCAQRWIFIVVCLGCVPSIWAPSVVLLLKNGDRITGKILSEDTNRVVLATSWSKELVVPLKEVSRREQITPALNAAETKSPAQVTAQANNPVKPASAVATATRPPASHYWVGDIQLGVDLAFSEKKRQLYTGHAKVTYAKERFRNIFEYDFSYGRTDGIISANRMEGSIRTDFDLGARFYVYNLAGAGYDEIRKIDYRTEIGPGLGYHLVRLTNFVLNTEAGFNYQSQHLTDNSHPELFFYRFAENFNWRIRERLTLDEKLEYLPRVEDLGEYKLRFESNLRYWLRNNLAFIVTVLDQYDTQTAKGVEPNDLQLRSSIGVKF